MTQAEDVDAEQVLQLAADVSDGLVERTDSDDARHGSQLIGEGSGLWRRLIRRDFDVRAERKFGIDPLLLAIVGGKAADARAKGNREGNDQHDLLKRQRPPCHPLSGKASRHSRIERAAPRS